MLLLSNHRVSVHGCEAIFRFDYNSDDCLNYVFLHTYFEPFLSAYHNKTPVLALVGF